MRQQKEKTFLSLQKVSVDSATIDARVQEFQPSQIQDIILFNPLFVSME